MAIRGTARLQGGPAAHGLDQRSDGPAVARRDVGYLCPAGHEFTVVLAAQAEPPDQWDCRCGRTAVSPDQAPPVASPDLVPARHRDSSWTRTARSPSSPQPARTPWNMLTERRTREELQALLEERLAIRRATR